MEKHDLSMDLVKLDYPTLLETMQTAVYCLRGKCEDAMREIQHAHEKVKPGISSLTVGYFISREAEDLARWANKLAQAAETLEAIEGMKSREQVKFINKPKAA